LLIATAALLVAPAAADASIVTNGDFETGTLSGWQHSDLPDSMGGSWFAYSGTTAPLFSDSVSAPPQGSFAAVTDQGGPGLRLLYQNVALPAGTTDLQLSAWVYYRIDASLASPPTLDFTGPPPSNEQYRFDVMKPGAPLDSVASGDILATLFRTVDDGPPVLAPMMKAVDLTSFAGQTVRIRLAEVDNQGVNHSSADAIAVNGLTLGKAKPNTKSGTAKLAVTVTDPGTVQLVGKGVKTSSAPAAKSVATSGGTTKLLVKPKGKVKKKLNSRGKAKVKVTITYTPNGSLPITDTRKVKLKKT
jgi:hypothetical protein